MATQVQDRDGDKALTDEKFVEDVNEKRPRVAVHSDADAALTRKILLKLDIRYKFRPNTLHSRTAESIVNHFLLKSLACPGSSVPMLVPRPHECWERQNLRTGSKLEDD